MSVHHLRGTLILYLAASGNVHRAVSLGGQQVPETLTNGSWYLGLLIAQALLGQPAATAEPFRRACALERAGRNDRQLGFNYLLHLELVALTYYPDDRDAYMRLAEEGEEAWRHARITFPDSQPPRIAWLPLLLITGEWEELARLIPTVGVPNTSHEAVVLSVAGQFARLRGDAEGAWRHVRTVLRHGAKTEPGESIFFVAQQMQRLAVALALDEGDLPSAREWLDMHDCWLAWSGAVLGHSEGQALWARYYREGGDRAQAHMHAERALVHATDPRQSLALLTAHRFLGELYTDSGRYQEADAHLQIALLPRRGVHRALRARPDAARAHFLACGDGRRGCRPHLLRRGADDLHVARCPASDRADREAAGDTPRSGSARSRLSGRPLGARGRGVALPCCRTHQPRNRRGALSERAHRARPPAPHLCQDRVRQPHRRRRLCPPSRPRLDYPGAPIGHSAYRPAAIHRPRNGRDGR